MNRLFIIDYENAQWCGGQLNVVVWAEDKYDAVIKASDHMEQEQRELFSDRYDNDSEEFDQDDSAYIINSVEEFGPDHEEWEFFLKDSQASFYPVIGKEHD